MDTSDNIQEFSSQLNDNEFDEELEEETETNETEEKEIENEETDKKESKDEFLMPEKFKDKSPQEIAKAYSELEKLVERKSQEKAEALAKEKAKSFKEEKKEYPLTPRGMPDFSKFTPEQFAEWMIGEVDKRAEAKARKIYQTSDEMRAEVRKTIANVRKEHPLLKENKEYTDLVLALIESSSARGEQINIKEACEKVDKLLGDKINLAKTDTDKLKKTRLAVEKTSSISGGKEKTEEDLIKEGLMGGKQSAELGGLGI